MRKMMISTAFGAQNPQISEEISTLAEPPERTPQLNSAPNLRGDLPKKTYHPGCSVKRREICGSIRAWQAFGRQ